MVQIKYIAVSFSTGYLGNAITSELKTSLIEDFLCRSVAMYCLINNTESAAELSV